MNKFIVGKEYKTSSVNQYMKNITITILKRTEKTIVTEEYGRSKIKINNEGNEYVNALSSIY
jgi:hypothetical protein